MKLFPPNWPGARKGHGGVGVANVLPSGWSPRFTGARGTTSLLFRSALISRMLMLDPRRSTSSRRRFDFLHLLPQAGHTTPSWYCCSFRINRRCEYQDPQTVGDLPRFTLPRLVRLGKATATPLSALKCRRTHILVS